MNTSFMKIEYKKILLTKRITIFYIIAFLISIFQFIIIKDGYIFYNPVEVFEESISGFISMLFPLVVFIYSNNYFWEHKHNFISNVYSRCNTGKYLFQKGIFNAIVTFITIFVFIISTYVFYLYIVPTFGMVEYSIIDSRMTTFDNTLSVLKKFGPIGYGILYSSWIAINAALYSSIAYVLTLHLKKNIVSQSIPILIYYIGNFLLQVLGKAIFSPIFSVFPFNLVKQPLYTLFVPFIILNLLLIITILYTIGKYKKGETYV